MTAREDEFGKRIKAYLDRGTPTLRSGVAYRLQQARAAALAQAAGLAEAAPAQALGRAHGIAGLPGSVAGGRARPFYGQARFWLALLILAAGVFGYQQWLAWQDLAELEDLDAQILTSDLPIDAYLDRGFQLWLKTPKADE